MEEYTGFAEVYDLFMDNVPYDDWCRFLSSALKQYGIEDGLILDLGCGTGTMTRLLADKGYEMIGVDLSEEMLQIAMAREEAQGRILYLNQDMRDFELYGTVRAVISVCDSLNYITEPEDLLTVFSLVSNYLDPGGVFIFDMNTIHKYKDILGEQTICENREDGSFIWDNLYEEEEQLNTYELTLYIRGEDGRYARYEETHFQKAYEMDTVIALLKKAGLEFIQTLDAETGGEVTSDSERIYYIAREIQKVGGMKHE